MPNAENINKVIAKLKQKKTQFLMNVWEDKNECGTVCCIGGWAETIARKESKGNWTRHPSLDLWLGLTPGPTLGNLCYGYNSKVLGACPYGYLWWFDNTFSEGLRKKIGIRVLEILRDKGKVDWDRAIKEVAKENGLSQVIKKRLEGGKELAELESPITV
jgi:hypothetical protein